MKTVLLAATLLLTLAGQLSARDYRVRNLGTLGGKWSTASALNASGQVVGSFQLPGSGNVHAFLWTRDSGMQDLGTLGGSSSTAAAINDAGQVAGQSALPGDSVVHAFRWTPEEGMQDLGSLGGDSSAIAINASGQVIGRSYLEGGYAYHAFSWTATAGMTDLGTFGGTFSEASALNDTGQIVGWASYPGIEPGHAFLWTQAAGLQDIDTLGSAGSIAQAVNSRGQAVGQYAFAGNGGPFLGFVWSETTGMQDVGSLGGTFTDAYLVNSSGQVVGLSDLSGNGKYHAFLWTQSGGFQDLGVLASNPRSSSDPLGLNNNGVIVGVSGVPFRWTRDTGMQPLKGINPAANAINDAGQIAGHSGGAKHAEAALLSPIMHVTVRSSQNPSQTGQGVTFTVVVNSVAGAPPDGELVQFKDGSKLLGTSLLAEGVASLTTSSLKIGTHSIRATYSGDSNYDSAKSAVLTQVVNP